MLVYMRFIQIAYQTLFCVNKMKFYSWEMIRFLIKNTKYRRFLRINIYILTKCA